MKITDAYVLRLTLDIDFWDLLIVETDNGCRGWGEITGSLNTEGVAYLLESVKPSLIGKKPSPRASYLQGLYNWTYPSTIQLRDYSVLKSGLDQALWDLYAKSLDLPLYKLYGVEEKKPIPLYANLNKAIRHDRKPETLADNGSKAIEDGFQVIKCTPFDEITPYTNAPDFTKSFERIDALVEHVPIEKIAIDLHQRFTRSTMASFLHTLPEKYGFPYWVEDPLSVHHYYPRASISDSFPHFRFAAGEDAVSMEQIKDIIDSKVYDIVMPDVKYIGGPSVILSLIGFIERLGKQISLHNPDGLISTAHSAHLSAITSTTTPLEYPYMSIPERSSYASPTETIKNGEYIFNDSPGIGIELDPVFLKERGRRFRVGTWEKV
ncbi:MAG: mandelate racemase/muconate lactonizing enzyme family protein [Sphaerochaetaceae bacterium]|jgi:galactonate dehydratase